MDWFASLWQDGRFALRSLAVQRVRVLAAGGMLALAIGIATAMFTIVDALVLRPVPFHEPDRLAWIYMGTERGGASTVSPAVFRAWRDSAAFAAVEAATSASALVETESGNVSSRNLARVTPGVFDLLGGVRPVQGRLFDATDGRPGSDDRILLSEDVWRSLYHSDPSLVGRTITIDDAPMVVVGILPSAFRFPSWNTVIWRAASFERGQDRPIVYARFSDAVPPADALSLATTAAREAGVRGNSRAFARPLAPTLDDYYAKALPMLSGGVVLLFVVLCANVSSLLLAGLTLRARELGTRAALGATRARLVRQVFLEAAMVAIAGVAAGTGLGWLLVSSAQGVLPQAAFVHSLNTLDIDVRALALTSLAGLIATLGVGVLTAVLGTRVDVSRLLQSAGRTFSAGRASAASRALLVCQVALSCTLVFGATLLVRSFVNLVSVDRGLDVRNVLTADVQFPRVSFATDESRRAGARVIEDAVRALPGVTATSWSYGTPPGGGVTWTGNWMSDLPGAQPVNMQVYQFIIDRGFFELYRVPILRGRWFQTSDVPGAVMVSERLAQALWPAQDPIGRSFTFDKFGNDPLHVIGLVRDIRYPSLDSTNDGPQIYVRFDDPGVRAMLSLRCDDTCLDAIQIRKRLSAALPGSRIDVMSPERWYVAEFVRPRAAAAVASAFAVTALIAAAAGLFSLFSQNVTRRRREFGIRTALGATPVHVRRLVWRDGLAVMLVGLALGALASVLLSRVLSSLLFGLTTTDPASWVIVAVTLAVTIVAAAWHPIRSAVRTTPVALLREE
ncbi:MAG: ABC transporter permease [Vicinamibacterales bacterium]